MDEHLGGGLNGSGTMERIQRVFFESVAIDGVTPQPAYEQMLKDVATIDSIAVLEFVTALEREFGVSLESKCLEFEFVRDLPRLASYLEEHQNDSRVE